MFGQSHIRSLGIAAAVIVTGATFPVSWAQADDDLREQLQTLRQTVDAQRLQIEQQNQTVQSQHRLLKDQSQRLASMEQQAGTAWLNERRAEEVKALVREVLADADSRASLAGTGAVAGHNGKSFFLASEDGKYLLNVGGLFQIRYVYNHREQANPATADHDQAGFSLRRVKFGFNGHVGDPKITYSLVTIANQDTGGIFLEEAVLGYAITDQLTAVAGRLKAPLTRESLLSTAQNLAIEPSYVDARLGGGYAEGAALIYTGDWLKLTGAFSDGAGSGNTSNATKDFNAADVDYAVTGRTDLKLIGEWAQWGDLSSWSTDKSDALFVGAAVHYQAGETGLPANDATLLAWTVDASYKASGFNIYGAITGHSIDSDAVGASVVNNLGYVVQGGYFVIPDKLQPFVRYERYVPDAGSSISIVTVGTNYYLRRHNTKLTLDVVWALDPIPTAASGIGLQVDNEENQVAVRAGVQVQF